MVDEAENLAWEECMRELSHRELPYTDWVEARLNALNARTRARRLAQARLRDRYGFKRSRRGGLVAKDVRRFYLRWSGDEGSPAEELAS